MDRERYLQEVWARLSNRMPRKDLDGVMRYYEEYFDEAGPQREAEVIAELGAPEELARRILESRTARGRRRGGAAVAAVMAVVLLAGFAAAVTMYTRQQVRHGIAMREPIESITMRDWAVAPAKVEPFTSLDLRVTCGDVLVVAGDDYGVELDGTGTWEVDDGTLVLKSQKLAFGVHAETARVTVCVPVGAWLDTVSIDADLGACSLIDLNVGNLKVDADCGQMTLNGVSALSASLTAGLGSVELDSVTAQELSVRLSSGELSGWELTVDRLLEVSSSLGSIDLSGQFRGEAYLKCDAGSISLTCWDAEEQYRYDLKTDLGSVRVNGGGGGNSVKKRSGEHAITAVSSMGDINLYFG